MKKVLLLLLLIAGQAQMLAQKPKVVLSDKPGWHKIGETKADFTMESDEIVIIGKNKLNKLKFNVTDAPINITSIVIHYDEGATQTVKLNQEIKSPGESREIPLQGNGKVEKVVITFKSLTAPVDTNRKANVELWGLKS
jgi:hypothetical protein